MGDLILYVRRVTSCALLFSALCGAAVSMPADPNRPLATQTCDAAQARLTEAHLGSPLLSPEEQAEVLRTALADVARLCGDDARDGFLQPLPMPKPATLSLQNAREGGQVLPLLPVISPLSTMPATTADAANL